MQDSAIKVIATAAAQTEAAEEVSRFILQSFNEFIAPDYTEEGRRVLLRFVPRLSLKAR